MEWIQNGECYKTATVRKIYLCIYIIQTKRTQMNYTLNLWTIYELQKQKQVNILQCHGFQILHRKTMLKTNIGVNTPVKLAAPTSMFPHLFHKRCNAHNLAITKIGRFSF